MDNPQEVIRRLLGGVPVFTPRTGQDTGWPEPVTPTKSLEEKMAGQLDELHGLLDEHAKEIETIEGFMAEFAKRAETAVNPTELQVVVDRVKSHNTRLAALLAKFPLVK